jgi:anti-sigma factor (TIGR02949 family)
MHQMPPGWNQFQTGGVSRTSGTTTDLWLLADDSPHEAPGRLMSEQDRLICDQVLSRLDEFLDRALAPAEQAAVERHLEECLHCGRALQFEATILDGLRDRLRRIQVPPGLLEAVRSRLQAEYGW